MVWQVQQGPFSAAGALGGGTHDASGCQCWRSRRPPWDPGAISTVCSVGGGINVILQSYVALAQAVNPLPPVSDGKNIRPWVNTQARIRVNRTSAGFLEGCLRFSGTESNANSPSPGFSRGSAIPSRASLCEEGCAWGDARMFEIKRKSDKLNTLLPAPSAAARVGRELRDRHGDVTAC